MEIEEKKEKQREVQVGEPKVQKKEVKIQVAKLKMEKQTDMILRKENIEKMIIEAFYSDREKSLKGERKLILHKWQAGVM